MSKFTKKLSKDELKMAIDIAYQHYGNYFVENAEDLAKQISEDWDCNSTPEECYPFVHTRDIEYMDKELILKNIFQ